MASGEREVNLQGKKINSGAVPPELTAVFKRSKTTNQKPAKPDKPKK